MQNKKILMIISSLMILIFHLWINLTNTQIESYLREICYIGVDIFFFISAFNIGKNEVKYKQFVKNRFVKIYLKFVIFSLITFFYKKWSIIKFIKVITGISFIEKGGGSFLWFIPAIMILYLLLPLYKKVDEKNKYFKYVFLILYLIIVVISSISNYDKLLIFINRMPIILMGYYYGLKKYKITKLSSIILLLIGTILSYFSTINKFDLSYFKEIYYVINIPLILGIIYYFENIKKFDNKIISNLSKITLEIYAFQMIFGYTIINKLFLLLKNSILTNLIIILLIILISYIFNIIYELSEKKLRNI